MERPPKRKCVELEMPYLPESSKPVLAVLEVVVLVKERLLNLTTSPDGDVDNGFQSTEFSEGAGFAFQWPAKAQAWLSPSADQRM